HPPSFLAVRECEWTDVGGGKRFLDMHEPAVALEPVGGEVVRMREQQRPAAVQPASPRRCGQRGVGGSYLVLQRRVAPGISPDLLRSNDAARNGLMSVGLG